MNHEIELNGKKYSFKVVDMDFEIDVDKDISIDYSNIIGDMVYTTLLLNKVGLFRADMELEVKKKDLEIKIFEATFISEQRRLASKNSGFCKIKHVNGDIEFKVSEKALEKCYYNSEKWAKLQNQKYILERDLDKIDKLYWSLHGKTKQLEYPLTAIYPDDMSEDLIAEKFNKLIKQKVK